LGVAGFGVLVAWGVGFAVVFDVVFGVAFVVDVVGGVDVELGGTELTVRVGAAVDDGLAAVMVPDASSSGLTPVRSEVAEVADVLAATGSAPPPGTVTHPPTVPNATTAAPRISARGACRRKFTAIA
jgi:hypothetical protein